MIKKLTDGIKQIGLAAVSWERSPSNRKGKWNWGSNAPQGTEQRGAANQIAAWLVPQARVVTEAVEAKLTPERQKLAVDAAYLFDLRENLPVQQQELNRIALENAPRDSE